MHPPWLFAHTAFIPSGFPMIEKSFYANYITFSMQGFNIETFSLNFNFVGFGVFKQFPCMNRKSQGRIAFLFLQNGTNMGFMAKQFIGTIHRRCLQKQTTGREYAKGY